MGKVYACVGRYATTPYTIKKTGIHVYCIEEFCFYIAQNASFIEDDVFDNDLLDWLEEECGLSVVARRLKAKARTDNKTESLVRTLFETIHYTTDEELEELTKLIRSNRNMSSIERLKVKADYFLNNNRYVYALQTYEELQTKIDKNRDGALMAAVNHNMGVAYAKMFAFEMAAKCFMDAYEIDGREEHLAMYLATYRIRLSEDAYLRKISEIPNAYEATALLENLIENAKNDWERSKEHKSFELLMEAKESGNLTQYEELVSSRTVKYKEEYRERMQS